MSDLYGLLGVFAVGLVVIRVSWPHVTGTWGRFLLVATSLMAPPVWLAWLGWVGFCLWTGGVERRARAELERFMRYRHDLDFWRSQLDHESPVVRALAADMIDYYRVRILSVGEIPAWAAWSAPDLRAETRTRR